MTNQDDTNPAEAKPERAGLSFIQPKDTARTLKARKPRRVLDFMRVALPVTGLLVIGALFLWPMIKRDKLVGVVLKNAPDLVIQNLHFTGLDSDNEPYSLAALKATRPQGTQNIYDLEKPEGELTLKDSAWVAVKARLGRYDQDSRKLWLGGNVQLFHDKGYQFTSDEAQVDLKDNYAWGEKPVLIQGDFGEIRGQGFKLLEGGHIMVVKGPARALLSLHPAAPSDTPDASKTKGN